MELVLMLVSRLASFVGSYAGLLLTTFLIGAAVYILLLRASEEAPAATGGGAQRQQQRIDDSEGYVLGGGPQAIMQDAGPEEMYEDDQMFHADFVRLEPLRYDEDETRRRAREFYELMNRRRTVRMFSDRAVPREVIENIILAAGTAPSGAHMEPWTYVVVSDPALKSEIRHVTETEEKINYERRMGAQWVSDLAKLRTEWQKPYIDKAPYLILIFVQVYGVREDGRRQPHYYHQISTSLSAGLLLAAIHNAGLVTVTSTPMNAGIRFQALLDRPPNEKFIMLLPVGYPADDAQVPDLHRKPLDAISIWV